MYDIILNMNGIDVKELQTIMKIDNVKDGIDIKEITRVEDRILSITFDHISMGLIKTLKFKKHLKKMYGYKVANLLFTI